MVGRRWNSRALWAWICAIFILVVAVQGARADNSYVVQAGDTLTGIAYRYGITASDLAAANGISATSWVYAGQTLRIPSAGAAAAPAPATGGSYVVRAGDTLYGIALRHGTTVQALMSANGLTGTLIYTGQTLTLPGAGGATAAAPAAPAAPTTLAYTPRPGEKWIDINLSQQRVTAYSGTTALNSVIVSTGLAKYPTVTGTYRIYVKYRYTDMRGGSYAAGDYYYLPDVPFTMYFYRGYGLHGTYWHNNFGTPMSHGCVNLRTSDAEWFFNWAEVGTLVVSHY